jgi:predicted GTPase
MAYDYSEILDKSRQWATTANNLGWLDNENTSQLHKLDSRSPEALFSTKTLDNSRPLIVAFMGGTGVGKSTLLNRLAGKAIAKSGIERPTSREVTLYHHQSMVIEHLPEHLPLAKINLVAHNEDARKNIIWIDMPDFDSTELHNKQQVLEWLPHIDILVYVVSPERYRDEKAWRILISEGGRHAWIFVINQWDKGQSLQFDDFGKQLMKAGFDNPVIYKTACTDERVDDEFSLLEAHIASLATTNTIRQLEIRGTEVRKKELKQALQHCRAAIGSAVALDKLKQNWQQLWQQTTHTLKRGFVWPISQMAQYYANHAADLTIKANTETNSTSNKPQLLWDDWAKARLDDALNELTLKADQESLPTSPLKIYTPTLRDKAEKIVQSQCELSARLALANPGNRSHRLFLKLMRLCEISLPLIAMSWVSYRAFISYYSSDIDSGHYLGLDFILHSILLITLSWLIPWFILKKAQPSLKSSAIKGLNTGVTHALEQIDTEVTEVIRQLGQQHAAQLKELDELIAECNSARVTTIDTNSPLNRMLI